MPYNGGWNANPSQSWRRNNATSKGNYLGQLFAQSTIQNALYSARLNMGNDIKYNVLTRLEDGLNVWARSLYAESENHKGIEEAHAKLAGEIQETVVKSYVKSQQKGRKIPSYRWADKDKKMRRYSNKQMLKALQSENFMSHDVRGIYFPNADFLDQAAPQWYRLNFGAKPATTPEVSWPNMKWGSKTKYETNVNINFSAFKPSAPFMVPSLASDGVKGLWSRSFLASTPANISQITEGYTGFNPANPKSRAGAGRNSALYIIPRFNSGLGFEKKASKGIVGSRFLDEGARYLNREYGYRMSSIFNEWQAKAVSEGRARAQLRVAPGERNRSKTEALNAGKPVQIVNVADSPFTYAEKFGDLSKVGQPLLDKWRNLGFDLSEFGF